MSGNNPGISPAAADRGWEAHNPPAARSIPAWIVVALLALIGLAGVGMILRATASGPGIGGDATIYLTSARNLLAGKGLGLLNPDGTFRPLPYTPPLFPLLLSALGLFGLDLVQAARWLNALLFGGTIWVAGAAVYRFTRQAAIALLAAALLMLSPVLVRVYSWAMAEPVFLFTGFLGLFLSVGYARRPGRALLAGAALGCGLSFLARYIGAGFVGAAALVLLLLDRRGWLARIRAALAFLGISLAPIAVWMAWDLWKTQTVASRSIQSPLGLGARLLSAFPPLKEDILFWLIPDTLEARLPHLLNNLIFLAGVVVLAALLAGVAWLSLSRRRLAAGELTGSASLVISLILLAAVFIAGTLLVYVTTFPPITLDNRMIVPLHVAALLLAAVLAGMLVRLETGRRWLVAGVWLVILGFTASYLYRTPRIANQYGSAGLGYMMKEYQESDTIRAVKALPAGTQIITNEITEVLYFTGRPSYALLSGKTVDPGSPPAAYGSDPSDAGQAAFRDGAALVIFNTLPGSFQEIFGDQGPARLAALTNGLYRAYSGSDGAIYYYLAP